MTDTTVTDRRRHSRVRSRLLVRIRSHGPLGDTALTRDISRGGLSIEIALAGYQQCGELMIWCGQIDIEVELPSGRAVPIVAEIMWCYLDIGGEAGRYGGGLRFLEMHPSDKTKLGDYLKARGGQESRRHSSEQGWSFIGSRPRGEPTSPPRQYPRRDENKDRTGEHESRDEQGQDADHRR